MSSGAVGVDREPRGFLGGSAHTLILAPVTGKKEQLCVSGSKNEEQDRASMR